MEWSLKETTPVGHVTIKINNDIIKYSQGRKIV